MPHPLLYTWNQDDDRTRAVDVVHIEPSIREGVHLVSSIYGPDASAPIYRFPPVNTTAPWIRGPSLIPNILTCEVGQWAGSPAPQFAFQWMADGVDIPGANSQTWLSTIEYDQQMITCEVRGFSYMGQAYAMTPDFYITRIEPIEILDQELFAVSGIQPGAGMNTYSERTNIITGVSSEDRSDVVRSVSYYLTGFSAEDRNDLNDMKLHYLTGLHQDDTLTMLDAPAINIINYEYADNLIESVPVAMNLKNFNAELGLAGWVMFGAVSLVINYMYDGNISWNGGTNVHADGSNIPYSYMHQDVPIEETWIVDVDAGTTNLELYWYQFSLNDFDQANIKVEFYDNTMLTLGSNAGPGLWAAPSLSWFYREFHISIPANTRFVRIIPEFNLQAGNNNDAGVDQIQMFIRKGDRLVSRSYGPSFEQWRIRFTLANTWSGTGLSELEFRATSGGADLCTGGTPLFGSAGLGVSDADFAFDDLRNTGYWAGEENAVTKGTAWIGYDMETPVRTQEINITARLGSDSLQVGREFYLEGSDDGIRWTRVQRFKSELVGAAYTSGQQKNIPVAFGTFDYFTEYFDGGSYSYDRGSANDNFRQKGIIFIAETRLNISHLRAMTRNQAGTYNYKIQLFRINQNKTGNNGTIGMISEILEDIAVVSETATPNSFTWKEFECSEVHEFEVGDMFVIRFVDIDAATNGEDTNEGRLAFISDLNGQPSRYLLQKVATNFANWNRGVDAIKIGDVNASAPNDDNISDFNWALDFKGSVF